MKWVTVYELNDINRAELLKSTFEAHGIQCVTADIHLINVAPHLTNAAGGVRIQVPNEDKIKAQALLIELGLLEMSEVRIPNWVLKIHGIMTRKPVFSTLSPVFTTFLFFAGILFLLTILAIIFVLTSKSS